MLNAQKAAANSNKPGVLLPVGDKLGWDTVLEEYEEPVELKSVADSCVLAQSLKQSREKWLHHTFPKFQTKLRNKASSDIPEPLPHTIQTKGRCDIEIGPHIFPETIVYEVNYLQPPSRTPVATATHGWTPVSPYAGSYYYHPQAPNSNALPAAVPLPTPAPTSTSSGPAVAPPYGVAPTSTPASALPTSVGGLWGSVYSQSDPLQQEFISIANTAASTDPEFSSALQLAIAGTATQEQLKMLGERLKQYQAAAQQLSQAKQAVLSASLSTPQVQTTQYSYPYAVPVAPLPPVRPFDIVLEFRDTPGERLLFPRSPVSFEKSTTESEEWDLKVRLPFDKQTAETGSSKANEPEAKGKDKATAEEKGEDGEESKQEYRRAHLVLTNVPTAVVDTITRWIGSDDKAKEYKEILKALDQPKRLYLGYRLTEGPLLSQLQTMAHPPMKLLKHGPNPVRPPRKRAPPKAKEPKEKPKTVVVSPAPTSVAPPTKDVVAPKPPKASRASAPTAAKRQKTAHRIPFEIQCLVCKMKDVPLILGGRYCRPCVESGRAATDSAYPLVTMQMTHPIAPPPRQTTVISAYPQLVNPTFVTKPNPIPSSSTTTNNQPNSTTLNAQL
ncbi:hypothetical protein FA15DRAFT_751868 [Coprinopsis marcescibilis]|uniref:Uncharacterized protein n=1 Tax=Coprinopsis marcescibilis TaxID=230819 RepID=A0A5C3LG60_COPMA|nr:hypothetical protein FA15DRAFT_751868 [Coprinopsis marcescibilis]